MKGVAILSLLNLKHSSIYIYNRRYLLNRFNLSENQLHYFVALHGNDFIKHESSKNETIDFEAILRRISENCKTEEDYRQLNNYFGTFIVGSDTVFFWNNIPWSKLYLDFVDNENKKIAYAASFFAPKFQGPIDILPYVGYWLSRFNDISVREASGVKLLSDTFNIKNGKHVLDPVFLLNIATWKSLIPANIRDFSKTKVLYSANYKELSEKFLDFECINNFKIEEWLACMMYSPLVVTDSFHAVCFRIMFNKPFLCIGKDKKFAHRIESLLELFRLPKKLLTTQGNEQDVRSLLKMPVDIDYQFEIPTETAEQIELTSVDSLISLNVVTIPQGKPQKATINLLAPIIINANNKQGMQMILSNSNYPVKYSLFGNKADEQTNQG